MKTLFVLLALFPSASFAGVTGLTCTSANGQLKVVFEDQLLSLELIPVDQKLIRVSRNGKPVNGLTAYLNKDFTKEIDFVIFEASDSFQNFHLEVKGNRYELSRLEDSPRGKTVLDAGRMSCRIVRP